MQYVKEKTEMNGGLLVLGGDNLFGFELVDFVGFYKEVGAECITTHQLDDVKEIKRTGVIELDEHKIVNSIVLKILE